MMAEKFEIEYEVSVSGLGEAALAAKEAKDGADQASAALDSTRASSSRTLPILMAGTRTLNATRLAIEQAQKAITTLNPMAAIYAFLNMLQVVSSLTQLMRLLRDSTAAASAAQAILATLTGNWWLIPLAIVAGTLIYSRIRSMQAGGSVPETGVYLLHKGESVVPRERVEIEKTVETTNLYSIRRSDYASTTHVEHYGPIFVTFEKQPRDDIDVDDWLGRLGDRISKRIRRG
jgi:hypothetical protein